MGPDRAFGPFVETGCDPFQLRIRRHKLVDGRIESLNLLTNSRGDQPRAQDGKRAGLSQLHKGYILLFLQENGFHKILDPRPAGGVDSPYSRLPNKHPTDRRAPSTRRCSDPANCISSRPSIWRGKAVA